MTKALCVASHICPRPTHSSQSPIWISDALLTESFHRFTRVSRRHGSTVPGPLEARRRASRRKNTSLAFTGAVDGVALDPSLLQSVGQQNGWWRGSDTHSGPAQEQNVWRMSALQHAPTASELLPPSWFMPFPPTQAGWSPADKVRVEVSLGSYLQHHRLYEEELGRFKKRLVRALNIEMLHQLRREHGLRFTQKPHYSELAFQHILKAGWTLEHITAFMRDPELNPPSASNYTLLMKHLETHAYSTGLNTTFASISQAVQLGLVSYDQIRQILTGLPKVIVPSASGVIPLREKKLLGALYRLIFAAIERSSVVSASDLGAHWFDDVVAQLSQPRCVKAQMLWTLRGYLPGDEVSVAVKIVSTWLKHVSACAESQAGTTMSRFLDTLPIPVLAETLCAITFDLAAHTSERSATLITWQIVLRNLKKAPVFDLFNHISKRVETGLAKCMFLAERQKLLVFSWLLTSLCHDKPSSSELSQTIDLESKFRKAFDCSCEDGPKDVLAEVLSDVLDLSLPHPKMLLKHLGDLTHGFVSVSGASDTLQTHLERLKKHKMWALLNDSTYWHATNNFPQSLSQIATSTNNGLKALEKLLSELIPRDKLALRLVLRILKHNIPFKLALSQAHAQRRQFLDEAGTGQPPESDAGISTPSDHVDPLQALFFMNRLAVVLATSPVISERLAYQKVYLCYLFLHRYGAPITPAITRALWHAGVTRYVHRGQTPTRFEWVLSKVNEVEGPDVARQLVWNGSFRDQRAADIERVGLSGVRY